ncbi:MAG: hypothetical protein RBU37_22735 [Myxococcota bacterium]|jgi:alpha-tubulin suppressor-like RCC1 family protein|nr:hypothetical protein [Myxococcota bacterium]
MGDDHAFFLAEEQLYVWRFKGPQPQPLEDALILDAPGARQAAFRIDQGYVVLDDGSVTRWLNTAAALPPTSAGGESTNTPPALTPPSPPPAPQEAWRKEAFPLDDVAYILSGGHHFCAITQSHRVLCWGSNRVHQLGQDSSLAASETPVAVDVEDVAELAVNGNYACVRHTKGGVSCWGDVPWPTFENGPGAASEDYPVTSTPTRIPQIESAVDLALGALEMCVVLADERVLCWGDNYFGQLGVSSPVQESETPLRIPMIDDAKDLALGDQHACVIRKDDTIWCWGNNEVKDYEPVLGAVTNWKHWAVPRQVEGFDDALKLFVKNNQCCAEMNDRTIRCWADTFDFYVDYPDGREERLALEQLDDFSVARESVVALKNGEVFLWEGGNESCALFTHQGLAKVTRVSSGHSHSCFLDTKNRMLCFGWAGCAMSGRTDDGDYSLVSKWVSGLRRGIVEMVSGDQHNCVRYRNGEVACWGCNSEGELGLGHQDEVEGAQALPGISDAIGLALGTSYSCVLHADQTVSCWGKLTDGTRTMHESLLPSRIEGLEQVVQVSVGEDFACARHADGGVSCWGFSSKGQLGIPNRNQVVELDWRAMLGQE